MKQPRRLQTVLASRSPSPCLAVAAAVTSSPLSQRGVDGRWRCGRWRVDECHVTAPSPVPLTPLPSSKTSVCRLSPSASRLVNRPTSTVDRLTVCPTTVVSLTSPTSPVLSVPCPGPQLRACVVACATVAGCHAYGCMAVRVCMQHDSLQSIVCATSGRPFAAASSPRRVRGLLFLLCTDAARMRPQRPAAS